MAGAQSHTLTIKFSGDSFYDCRTGEKPRSTKQRTPGYRLIFRFLTGLAGMATRSLTTLIVLDLLLAAASFVQAQSLPAAEKQKIEVLIKQVSNLKDAQFIRNGSSFNADKAATFLRRKWQANDSAVKTARDFIDKVGSFSGTSGKPYVIRFKDGREIKSKEFLLAELKKIENVRAAAERLN
jgi:hypothetical protein